LNAPELAADSRTDTAISAICHPSGRGPGVAARPATALSAIATPIRSLKTAAKSASARMAAYRISQIAERYFQFTK
jgi:hypothetical protein